MTKRSGPLLAVAGGVALLGLSVALAACSERTADRTTGGGGGSASNGDAAGRPHAASIARPEAGNPDRGRWVDLRTEPWHPEAVGGTLVYGRGSGPDTLNNLLWRVVSTRSYFKHYLAPFLLEEIPDAGEQGFRVRPAAAASLPRWHADRLTTTWTLRDDLVWEDGEPLTAHDYAFTFELMQDPDVRCEGRRQTLDLVKEVRAVDERTLEVRFARRHYNAAVRFGLEFTVVPAHRVPTDAAEFNALRQHVGFGPYRVEHWDEKRVLLVLRDRYRERPFPIWPCYVERIEIRFVRDPSTLVQQLRRGEVDLAAVPTAQFEALGDDEEFTERCWRAVYDLPGYDFVAWNTRDQEDPDEPHPLFGTARARRAMTRLVDRDHVIEEVRHGFAKKVNGPYWHRDADYDHGIPQIPYDPDGARRELEALGWALNDRGFLERDGRTFRFELLVFNSPTWTQPAEVIRDSARRAGVDVVVKPLPDQAFMDAVYGHRFDAFLVRQGLRPPIEPDQYELFHSSLARKKALNWIGLQDERVDRMLETIRTTFGRGKRLELRRQFHRLFDEVHPYSVLYNTYSCAAINRRWANVKIHDLGIWFRDLVLRELFWR